MVYYHWLQRKQKEKMWTTNKVYYSFAMLNNTSSYRSNPEYLFLSITSRTFLPKIIQTPLHINIRHLFRKQVFDKIELNSSFRSSLSTSIENLSQDSLIHRPWKWYTLNWQRAFTFPPNSLKLPLMKAIKLLVKVC